MYLDFFGIQQPKYIAEKVRLQKKSAFQRQLFPSYMPLTFLCMSDCLVPHERFFMVLAFIFSQKDASVPSKILATAKLSKLFRNASNSVRNCPLGLFDFSQKCLLSLLDFRLNTAHLHFSIHNGSKLVYLPAVQHGRNELLSCCQFIKSVIKCGTMGVIIMM